MADEIVAEALFEFARSASSFNHLKSFEVLKLSTPLTSRLILLPSIALENPSLKKSSLSLVQPSFSEDID